MKYIVFVLFLLSSCVYDTVIPQIEELLLFKHSLRNSNTFSLEDISLSVPEEWNFIFGLKSNDSIISFADKKKNIMGHLRLYGPYVSKHNLKELFLDSLKSKGYINYEWLKGSESAFIAKGKFAKYEKHLEETIYYTSYLSLFVLKGALYELNLLGKGRGLKFDDEALFILNNVKEIDFSSNIMLERYNTRVEVFDNWFAQTTMDTQVVNLRNKENKSLLVISYLGSLKYGFDVFASRQINDFSYYLEGLGLDYYYDIEKSSLLGKDKVKLLYVFANLDGVSIEIRKYYYEHNSSVYELALWYEKAYKEDVDAELKSILNNIKLR